MYVRYCKVFITLTILVNLLACSTASDIDEIPSIDSNTETNLFINFLRGEIDLSFLDESLVNTLDLFLFNAHDGLKEAAHSADESEDQSCIMSSSTGSKILMGIANHNKETLANCQDVRQMQELSVDLHSQYNGLLTMVGEKQIEIKGGYNQTELNLTRLVGKIILKKVTVEKPYNNGHIKVKRAFMMNVNTTSKLRGKTASPEVSNPVYQGYTEHASFYLSFLSADIKIIGNNKENLCHFYVFENTSETNPTVLFIEAEYKQQQGNKTTLVYYPIVIKSEGKNAVLRNNAYTLSAKIRRPGTTQPEIGNQVGDLEVSVAVEDWMDTEEQDQFIE